MAVSGGRRLLDGLRDDARLVEDEDVPLLLGDLLRAQILVLEGYASDGRPEGGKRRDIEASLLKDKAPS